MPSDFDLTPPVVLMKGTNHPTFVISFRSQKESVITLAWQSAAMIWGGAAITLLGLYTLWTQWGRCNFTSAFMKGSTLEKPVANCLMPSANR